MSSAQRLSEDQVRQLAHELAAGPLAASERQEQPVAVLLAGQSGAGKSTLAAELSEDLRRRGGVVTVDADLIRASLPYYDELDPRTENVSAATQVDAGLVAQEVRKLAIQGKRNLLVDGTLRDPDRALEVARGLQAAGYRVELHALAVNDQISYERACQRAERDLQDGTPARLVPKPWHDESFRGAAASVRRLEFAGAVDRIAIYNRLNDPIHDQAPIPGQAVAGDVFDRARQQLTDFERVSLAKHWTELAETMQRRGASAEEMATVQLPRERAHYTLRVSPAAAESHDHADPAAALESKELAARYGARLERAFRSGDKGQSSGLPELSGAWAALAAGARLAEQHGAQNAVQALLHDRIADGLREGRALRPIAMRAVPTPAQEANTPER